MRGDALRTWQVLRRRWRAGEIVKSLTTTGTMPGTRAEQPGDERATDGGSANVREFREER